MENKFFLKAICTVAILTTAAIASAEPVIIEITAQDLAPYYGARYAKRQQYSAAVEIQSEQTYAVQAPVIVEERRAAAPPRVVNPIENYLGIETPLLRPMRGVLPTLGLTAEEYERLLLIHQEQQ